MIVLNDLLEYKNYKIYQDTDMFCFSLDSILLANFVTINKNIKNIMDIGCGNAPIPLVLTTKTNASIIGVDIQNDVYNLAAKSVNYNKCDDQIKIINDDINNLYKKYESDVFDVITCNPPYFKVNEKTKQNDSEYKKIARHELTLNLVDICKISRKLLKNNGVLALVHRPDRMIEIFDTMRKNNIEPKKIQFIYPKYNTDCNLILVEGTKNGKSGVKILEPLIVHDEDGNYTEDVKRLFRG